jgi:plastocyanin
VSIKFTNSEPVPHNVSFFKGSDATGENVFRGDIVTGPVTKQYRFAAPGPGEYYFQCDVHPNMKGRATSK